MPLKFANRVNEIQSSEVRELLKLTEQPDFISFAGGLPAPELFPIEEIQQVNEWLLKEDGQAALQYSTTEGFEPLRAWIAQRMNQKLQTNFDADNILITSGSQQAIDLTGKIFLDEGDVVFCESPTYLAALNAFRAYGCQFVEIATDENGMDMEDLEAKIKQYPQAKLIYVIPEFQNPTGLSWNLERRQQLAKLSEQYQLPVLEDNPYGELRFEGEDLPSIRHFDQSGTIICTGTFSKIFCPGYRIGWIAGDKEILKKYTIMKQGTDLHSNTKAQREIALYLEHFSIDKHIATIRNLYLHRRNLMLAAIEQYFPKEVQYTRPEGGLFVWVTLPEYMDVRPIAQECLAEKVAFVSGETFYPTSENHHTFRLNFSSMPDERIKIGIEKLGRVLYNYTK
ncbi:PLP-dependent aminotransferase family protein [Enterococcus saccharolyticus]|uniref:aminotransferase-like domain-containing protein n=1 Tax=Enterococcus TaxID=1350 RepID=UPI001E33F02F|nr:PLP-dependent aminotransferase family protein [Enterococcus saccharolyticus]MCD5003293.1 PLP-dependent aminotransferase family protein [Enterococcus saccharolyticus]